MKSNPDRSASRIAGLLAALLLLVSADRSPGAFVGPYSLTPPAPGIYGPNVGSTFGGWMVTTAVGGRSIDTTLAPETLGLFAGSDGHGNKLALTTNIIASGTLSFDYSASYFSDTGFDSSLYFLHNGLVVADAGESGSFSMPVLANDTFGFFLNAGYGTGPEVAGSSVAVSITNFNVIPEPGSITLLGLGMGALLIRRKRGPRLDGAI